MLWVGHVADNSTDARLEVYFEAGDRATDRDKRPSP
jgi:hypothetical protein